MQTLKVGDRVRIIILSRFGKQNTKAAVENPHCMGTITEINNKRDLPIVVMWDNTEWNYYDPKDLVLTGVPINLTRYLTGNDPARKKTTLPEKSEDRKDFPLYSGPVKYFPKALAEVAYICKIGNDKHNPGQPLHHARGKSADHADCILRHMIDMEEDYGKGVGRDEQGVPQVAYIAWRALALAQEWYEKHDGTPIAPGAKGE